MSADGDRWVILDAAPELRQQIIDNSVLHPRRDGRDSPIAGVVLTSGEVDHVAGLLCLREGQPFTLMATGPTLDNLTGSPIFGVLRPGVVERRPLRLDEATALAGLSITAFAVPGKVPLYREGERVTVGDVGEDVVGLDVSDGTSRIVYVPGVAHLPPPLARRLGSADLLFLDGTTYTDDELVQAGLSTKTAGRMGHLPMTGEGASLAALPADARARRVYIHLNNTNPVLIEDSPERAAVEAAGWTVARDGQEFAL